MTVEEFVRRLQAVLYTEGGWDQPLTPERLSTLLIITMEERS